MCRSWSQIDQGSSSTFTAFLLCNLGNSNVSVLGFTAGSVVKNLSANAKDMGSIPGLGRSHMLQSN